MIEDDVADQLVDPDAAWDARRRPRGCRGLRLLDQLMNRFQVEGRDEPGCRAGAARFIDRIDVDNPTIMVTLR